MDIGGTFTDIVLAHDGRIQVHKTLSTPGDYSQAILDGLDVILADASVERDKVGLLLHATTIATNAILQRRGARTGLVTTRGFRDVLELGRMRRPVLYDLAWEKPEPLVGRHLRLEINERISSDGSVIVPLSAESVREVARRFAAENVESIAVCLLNAYRNPAHEREVAALLAEALPGVHLSISSDVLREIQEYERTSTTVINAYLQPVVESYLSALLGRLDVTSVRAPLLVMQSGGGLMPAQAAAQYPIHIVESGPAAGVIGGLHLSKMLGLENIITFDMGGTTAKASIIEAGRVSLVHDYEVGAGISIGTRMNGGGYLLRVPAIDLAEVGAGGGSMVWIDKGGALRIGPESAGADPGPVCYGLSGTTATITDANVVLGYISPGTIAGGSLPIDAGEARRAIETQVARPLGLEVFEASYGVYLVANSNMIRAIRAVTTERGRDPRQFTLVAFGGSGPIHAAEIARFLDIEQVVIPPAPGLFSAFGLLYADVVRRVVQSSREVLNDAALPGLEETYRRLETDARRALEADGYRTASVTRLADLRYVGQTDTLLLEVPASLGQDTSESITTAFAAEHKRRYGYAGNGPIEVTNLRVATKAATGHVHSRWEGRKSSKGATLSSPSRKAYFGPAGLLETPVIERAALGSDWRTGPLIVDEYDATVVVPPACRVRVDDGSNIVIQTSVLRQK